MHIYVLYSDYGWGEKTPPLSIVTTQEEADEWCAKSCDNAYEYFWVEDKDKV